MLLVFYPMWFNSLLSIKFIIDHGLYTNSFPNTYPIYTTLLPLQAHNPYHNDESSLWLPLLLTQNKKIYFKIESIFKLFSPLNILSLTTLNIPVSTAFQVLYYSLRTSLNKFLKKFIPSSKYPFVYADIIGWSYSSISTIGFTPWHLYNISHKNLRIFIIWLSPFS